MAPQRLRGPSLEKPAAAAVVHHDVGIGCLAPVRNDPQILLGAVSDSGCKGELSCATGMPFLIIGCRPAKQYADLDSY